MASVKDDRTIDMFLIPQEERPNPATSDYSLDVATKLKIALDFAHDAGLDRHAVAAEMCRLTGREIHKSTLDKWTAPGSDGYNIPLFFVVALELACKTTILTDWLVNKRGGRVAYGKDALSVLMNIKAHEKKKLEAEMKQIEKMLGAQL